MRESFIFYKSFYEALEQLPDSEQILVYRAIAKYSLTGEVERLCGIPLVVFTLIKPQLEANNKRYIEGKKGGRPKKETIGFEIEKPNENVNANANANENENENENENDIPPSAPKGEAGVKKSEHLKAYDRSMAILEGSGLDEDTRGIVSLWLEYKKERRDKYTEVGFRALISEVKSKVARYGFGAVSEVVRQSVSNNYAGIVWDKLGKTSPPGSIPPPSQAKSFSQIVAERQGL